MIHALCAQFAFVQQVNLKFLDVGWFEQIGRSHEILGELVQVMDIVSLGGGREITCLHVVNHSLAKGCHGGVL